MTSPDSQPPRSAAITASRFFGPPANAIVGRFGGASSATLVTRALVDTSTSLPRASIGTPSSSATAPSAVISSRSCSVMKPSS